MRIPPASRTRAFSLLELIVVMGILLIVASLTVPAMNGFGRTHALTTGGDLVANLAALARQEAMTRNTLTALVLLRDQGTEADYRTFTVATYEAGIGWRQITAWEQLPSGIVVDRNSEQDETTDYGSFVKNSQPTFPLLGRTPSQENPPVNYQGSKVRSFAFRIFLPNGSLMNAEQPAHLRVVEGHQQGSRTIYTRPGNEGKPANFYDISLIGATGIAKVSRP